MGWLLLRMLILTPVILAVAAVVLAIVALHSVLTNLHKAKICEIKR